MTIQKISGETEGPLSLRQRAALAASSLRAWASTEAGGWIIVCVLAFAAIAAAGAAVVLPRLNAAAPGVQTRAAAPQAAPVLAEDLVDFTLAPEAVQNISYAEARIWNDGLPFSTAPIRPMGPLIAPTTDVEAYSRALDCLTAAVYYEAASETPQGQAAVAQVVLNRARHPAYPRSVCGVVFQGSERTTGCQFSFTCDGAMARVPSPTGWARARTVASAALNGTVVAGVGTATHYHTDWVAPYWAPRLSKIVKIGTHIFYRWNGAWGLPTAFTGAYSGGEPVVAKMAGLSTIAAQPEVEVIARTEFILPVIEETVSRPPPMIAAAASASSETGAASAAEAANAQPVAARPEVVVQRDVPIMADPLVSPTAAPTRQRQRIARSSGW
ncbi:MAG: cell wall hydrolase [Alphaproteobacteria bacterium]|nr:cell wall hydrolase [Alphaproteobacteria bacterium]MBU2380705.1 cell wall hydrolase [Alphaproteobacteria bacterium]